MPGTAPSRANLLSQLRTGFTTQPTTPLSSFQRRPASGPADIPGAPAPRFTPQAAPVMPTPAPASAAPEPLSTSASPAPVAESFFSTQEQLDTLEKVMDEVMAAKTVAPVVAEPASAASQPAPAATVPPFPETLPDPVIAAMPQALNQQIQAAQQAYQPTVATPAKEALQTVPQEVPAPAPVSEAPVYETPQPPEPAANASLTTEAGPTYNQPEAGYSAQYQEVGPLAPEISPEIAAYLEEIKNHQEQLPHEIVINGQDVQLQPPAQPLRPVIVLPITPQVEEVGAKQPPSSSIRWLVEWSRRLMKMFSGKVIYEEVDTKSGQ